MNLDWVRSPALSLRLVALCLAGGMVIAFVERALGVYFFERYLLYIILPFALLGFGLLLGSLLVARGSLSASERTALLVGFFSSQLPALLIVVAGIILTGEPLVGFGGGIVISVFWCSIIVPRWRGWAIRKGADSERLRYWGVRLGITARKGSWLEKAEIYLSDSTYYTLLTGLLVLTFLTVETLIAEYLERVLALPGFLGPLGAAAIAGALVFPVHQSLRRFVRSGQETGVAQQG